LSFYVLRGGVPNKMLLLA